MDIAEILKRAKRPERTVDLCLDADLAAEHEELNRQLQEVQRQAAASKASTGQATELARRIRDIEDRMAASVVTFRLRGLPYFEREEWLEAHPPREGKQEIFDPVGGLVPLIAACCIDPVMTEDQARELVGLLGTGQTDKLFSAAWQATNGDDAVPFSVAASVTLREPARKSK